MAQQRAPKGTGSVFKTRNNGKDVWCASSSYTDETTGKRRFIRGYGATPGTAVANRQARLSERLHGEHVIRVAGPTVAEYVDTWLTESEIRASSRNKYRKDMELHVVPHIGGVKLKSLSSDHLRKLFYQDLKSLGSSARKNVYVNLRTMLNRAVKNELIEINPLSKVDMPKHQSAVATPDRDFHNGRRNVVHGLYTALADPAHPAHDFHPLLGTLLLGLRRSEVLGLTWDRLKHLNAKGKAYILVDQQLHKPTGADWTLTATKTEPRRVPLPENLRKELLALHRATRNERRLEPVAQDLVFVREGKHISYNTLYRMWHNALDLYLSESDKQWQAEHPDQPLYRFRIHYLRHIAASDLANAGLQQSMIDAIIGHSTASTSATYRHINDAALNTVRSAFSDYL